MKASEAKQESLQKIRFEAKATFNEKPAKLKNKQLYLRLNELVMSKVTPLFSQESTAIFNEQQQVFFFPRFEFTSDISRSSLPVPQKTFLIEIFEVDPKNKQKKKFVGKTQFLMRDALKKGHTGKMTLFILDEKNRFMGRFEVS